MPFKLSSWRVAFIIVKSLRFRFLYQLMIKADCKGILNIRSFIRISNDRFIGIVRWDPQIQITIHNQDLIKKGQKIGGSLLLYLFI